MVNKFLISQWFQISAGMPFSEQKFCRPVNFKVEVNAGLPPLHDRVFLVGGVFLAMARVLLDGMAGGLISCMLEQHHCWLVDSGCWLWLVSALSSSSCWVVVTEFFSFLDHSDYLELSSSSWMMIFFQ